MSNETAYLLEKALKREKKARKVTEKLLEQKVKELEEARTHLRESNNKLKELLFDEKPGMDDHIMKLPEPYIMIDIETGKTLYFNEAARVLLGPEIAETLELASLLSEKHIDYAKESLSNLLKDGYLNGFIVEVETKKNGKRRIKTDVTLVYDQNGKPFAVQGIINDITNTIEAQRDLENQKKLLDIVMNESSVGILLLQNDTIAMANKAFCNLMNYEEVELKKLKLEEISTIEDISHYEEILNPERTLKSNSFKVTRRFEKKNGGQFLGKTSIKNIYQGSGQAPLNVVIIEAIDKKERIDYATATHTSHNTTLVEHLQCGIMFEDSNRRLMMINQKFLDIFSMKTSIEKLKGIDCRTGMLQFKNNFIDPEGFLKVSQDLVKSQKKVLAEELTMKDGQRLKRDYIPLFKDGVLIGHLWSYTEMPQTPKIPAKIQLNLPQKLKLRLDQQKQRYSSIIDSMNLGLAEVDKNEKIVHINDRYCEMIGKNREELLGENLKKVMQLDSACRSLVTKQLEQSNKGEAMSCQIEIKEDKGEKKYWMISSTPAYDEEGNISGSIGVYFDVTKQRKLELHKEYLVKELEESNKGLQEYAHIVSHDLKSPLRSVSALVDWLVQDYQDKLDENGIFNLKMIQDKIEGMDQLIGGILKYSTLSSNNLENVSVDITKIINEISEIIYLPENVAIRTLQKLPVIKADKTMMHQLFQNFLSNAAVHIDKEDGLIEVDYLDLGTHWQFSVKDNGVGIPKEYHSKIFQIFQSIGNREKSTGIGLSIVKKIIERYQGKVWLESEVGKGTTFFFTLIKI